MEIYYRREMKGNYLIIEPDDLKEVQYATNMMLNNSIKGLLKLHLKQRDQNTYFCYEITSKQPLERVLESRYITHEEIRQVITGIHEAITYMNSYLLGEEQILFEKQYIYIVPETFEIYLCLIPGRAADFSKDLEQLFQYILKKVDHQDQQCVVLAYSLFQACQKENYSIDILYELMLKTRVDEEPRERDKRESPPIPQPKIELQPEAIPPKQESGIHWSFTCILMLTVPLLIWFFKGVEVIIEYRLYLIVWEILCVLFLVVPGKKKKGHQELEENIWNKQFEYEENENSSESIRKVPSLCSGKVIKQPDKEAASEVKVPVKDLQTVLLVDLDSQVGEVKLASEDPQYSDIYIPYSPFIIGKQDGLVDFSIDKDTISRFHIRIDKKDDIYYVTDLNSTNGTKVNERFLETNETVRINKGEYIYLADLKYQFI